MSKPIYRVFIDDGDIIDSVDYTSKAHAMRRAKTAAKSGAYVAVFRYVDLDHKPTVIYIY